MPPSNLTCANSSDAAGAPTSGRGPELDSKLSQWLEWTPPGSDDHEAVKKMVAVGEFDALEKIMMGRKNFGTAGIRAKMGPG